MFELTLANWPPICRALSEEVSEWFMVLCVVHKLIIGFAVVGVINGVFMQETFKVASTDDIIMTRQRRRQSQMHKAKMEMLFNEADADGNGRLSLEEFGNVVSDTSVSAWLSSMELDCDDV